MAKSVQPPAEVAKKAPPPKPKRKRTPKAKAKPKAKPKAKRGRGRPPFKPTGEQRRNVETMAGLGIKQEDICLLVVNPQTKKPIDKKTLAQAFVNELRTGAVKANSAVVQSLYQQALQGNMTAAIWWTKARMGWSEVQKHRIAAKHVDQMSEEEILEFLGGEPDPSELRALARARPAGHA